MPDNLEYLFYNYGKVRSKEVTQKEHEVMMMSWQPTDPIVLLTRPIEQLQKLATQVGIPYTDSQILVRITVGGDKLDYAQDAGSPAANLLETKILLNSVISDANKGARFMCADIKDHFLTTPMDEPEYMKVQYKYIPNDIRLHYNLDSKVTAD